jgi:hypothetical protein
MAPAHLHSASSSSPFTTSQQTKRCIGTEGWIRLCVSASMHSSRSATPSASFGISAYVSMCYESWVAYMFGRGARHGITRLGRGSRSRSADAGTTPGMDGGNAGTITACRSVWMRCCTRVRVGRNGHIILQSQVRVLPVPRLTCRRGGWHRVHDRTCASHGPARHD